MASAAAVAADSARSPLGRDVDEANGITSAINANDEDHTGLTDDDDDDQDDFPSKSKRAQRPTARDQQEEGEDGATGLEDDLFGDDDEDATAPAKVRHVDDEELDSGDDEDRDDRVGEAEDGTAMVERTRQVQETDLPRMPIPEPSDGELYLLKVPKFLSVAPRGFTQQEFEAPKADHHKTTASKNFSAYDTAMTTIRWRRSPSKPSELQSNARINRWSDGSLTLQFASNPTVQYDLKGNALVPPLRNPVIPTPTSIHTNSDKGGRSGMNGAASGREKFDASKHAFTYLVMPLPNAGLMKVTHPITAGLTISPPEDMIDEAIVNLQADLAVASGGRKANGGAVAFTDTMEDPELAKKRAEQAEREKAKARKKADAQLERERERSNRTLGRSGLSSSRYGGLSAGLLEDDEGLATTRGRGATRPKGPRRRRANSEYSSEEDYGRRSFKVSKEDDYDVEDDFVAGSDEEEEVVEDEDEDEDEGIIEEGRAAARREGTPKRQRPDREEDEDDDAEGEDDDAGVAAAADRKKRRLIVEDDDEDE